MEWFDITLIGFIAGTFGTSLGGILSFLILKPSNKTLGIMLGVAAGIMLSIVFMELLDEAANTSYPWTVLGLLAGIIAFLFLDNFFPHKHFITEEVRKGRFLKKGILIATGIALHNVSEGIAIGAGFAASTGMGMALAVLISLHNVPEGLAVAIPLNIGGMGRAKVFGITMLAGLPMGVGALLGSVTGNISAEFLALSLSFAAGAMLYIVFDELIPDVLEVVDNHTAIWGLTAGILIGMTMVLYL